MFGALVKLFLEEKNSIFKGIQRLGNLMKVNCIW